MKDIVLIGFLTAVLAFSATPVATVSSAGAFELRGNTVPVNGIPSWPVMAGDEISTVKSAGTIQFIDGSVATLAPNSHAKVEKGSKGRLVLRLLAGAMMVTIPVVASLDVYSGGSAMAVQPGVATPVAVTQTAKNGFQPLTFRPPPPGPVSSR